MHRLELFLGMNALHEFTERMYNANVQSECTEYNQGCFGSPELFLESTFMPRSPSSKPSSLSVEPCEPYEQKVRQNTSGKLGEDESLPDRVIHGRQNASVPRTTQRKNTPKTPEERVRGLQERAVRMLAMRDHSELELRRKLATPSRFSKEQETEAVRPEEIEQVINTCREHNWLDDSRFAVRFIESRYRKGYGAQRIRQEMQQKGVGRDEIDSAFIAFEGDWCALARDVAQRKFGTPLPAGFPEKIKVQRFLQYRGFYMEEIQQIYSEYDEL